MRPLLLAVLLAAPAVAREAEAPAVAAPEISVRKLDPGVFVVTQRRPFSANALLVEMGPGDLVLVDTLYTPAAMKELLAWVDKNLPRRRLLAVNTHFHSDRTGGNALLKEKKIPVYASDLTVKLMKSRGRAVMEGVAGAIADESARAAFLSAPVVPAEGVFALATGLKLSVGGEPFEVRFHGAGHTPDNVVVWFPSRKLLYAGCLALSSDRVGNTSDADLKAWPKAVAALSAYGATRVIPGHGAAFEPAVLERTAAALEKRSSAD